MSDVREGHTKAGQEAPAKCPECGGLMADMGLDFESPKKNDVRAWEHMALLYHVGITFHSCGCTGPGYIPKDKEELIAYFSGIKRAYLEHQSYWARRQQDPETPGAIARDERENWRFLSSIPKEMKGGTRKKPRYDAEKGSKYWNKRVLEIEDRIRKAGGGGAG